MTETIRVILLILSIAGALLGWWGWAAFWFCLLGNVTVKYNGRQV